MFAPDGFVPFASAKSWILDRAGEFYRECALPWATRKSLTSLETASIDPLGVALAGQALYQEWLISWCLAGQVRAVYLSSPTGQIMRASDVFFSAEDQLCWYDFEWPLLDDDLRKIVESENFEQILNSRFGYHFWDELSCCIQMPDADAIENLPDYAHQLLRHIEPFNGWAVCLRQSDCQEIEEFLSEAFDWSGSLDRPSQKGRPRKQEVAAKLYHSLYPDGHEVKGQTWQQAAQAVGKAGKTNISIDTLRRALAKY